MSKMKDAIIGSVGIAAVNGADTVVEAVSNTPINSWIDAIVSVIIAIATLFGLFKKKKKNGNTK